MMLGLINRNFKLMTIPTTICLPIGPSVELKLKVLLEFHAEHRSSLHVYPTAFTGTKLYCTVTEPTECLTFMYCGIPVGSRASQF